MAELEIGKHCSMNSCKLLDFLPFICDGCSQIFCLEHKGRTAHHCQDENYQNTTGIDTVIQKYNCTFENCQCHEQIEICCTLCDKAFCLAHRNPEEHDCTNLKKRTSEPTNLQKNMSKIVDNIKPKPDKKVGKKNEKLEAKVNLMKIKMKAVGDKGIPTNSRVYFEVNVEKLNQTKLVYFGLDWTIGRCVDYLSKLANIFNKNNQPNEPLLSLFTASDAKFIKHNYTVEELLSNNITNSGSKLILKHIDRNLIN